MLVLIRSIDIFCKASPFFRAAFEGQFKEANGVITLPEQEPKIFKFFVKWVYTRRLRGFYYPEGHDPSLSQVERDMQEEVDSRQILRPEILPWDDPIRKRWDLARYHDTPLLSLVKLYVLADALQVYGLRDHVISTIDDDYYPDGPSIFWRQKNGRVDNLESPIESINLVWEMTTPESKLGKLFLDMVINMASDFSTSPYVDTLSSDITCQALSYLYRWYSKRTKDLGIGKDTRGYWDVCDLHDHDAVSLLITKNTHLDVLSWNC